MNAPIAPEPQITYVRTAKSRYPVEVRLSQSGQLLLVARQPSGKARYLTKKDVGTARFYGAIEHFQSQHPAAGSPRTGP